MAESVSDILGRDGPERYEEKVETNGNIDGSAEALGEEPRPPSRL